MPMPARGRHAEALAAMSLMFRALRSRADLLRERPGGPARKR